jgi:hypothetical protein
MVHAFSPMLQRASQLWSRMQSLGLPEYAISRFGSKLLVSKVDGLQSELEVHHLGSLVGNEAVWEEVVNATLETFYIEATIKKGLRHDRCHLYPTYFLGDVISALSSGDKRYPKELQWARVGLTASGGACGFKFITVNNNHYTAWSYDATDGSLSFFNSLGNGNDPTCTVQPAIEYFLKGLGLPFKKSIPPTDATYAYQPPDSNSCGIAALNFIEHSLGLTKHLWNEAHSRQFRDQLIQKFVLWDLAAERCGQVSHLRSHPAYQSCSICYYTQNRPL